MFFVCLCLHLCVCVCLYVFVCAFALDKQDLKPVVKNNKRIHNWAAVSEIVVLIPLCKITLQKLHHQSSKHFVNTTESKSNKTHTTTLVFSILIVIFTTVTVLKKAFILLIEFCVFVSANVIRLANFVFQVCLWGFDVRFCVFVCFLYVFVCFLCVFRVFLCVFVCFVCVFLCVVCVFCTFSL